ncbi:hypothetical protein EIN_492130, partial [Entamoeba invadens IP1]
MDFSFSFQAVFHTDNAPLCKSLTQKCTNEIINTMRDCNDPDIEPTEMSNILLQKKELVENLKTLIDYMKEEVNVIGDEEDQKPSKEIYDESLKIVATLEDLQQKDKL